MSSMATLALSAVVLLAGPVGVSPQEPEDETQPPQRVVEVVTVTATRLPAGVADLPAPVRTWQGDELRSLPALGLDEALRGTPEFSLFRRTSSLHAHPTSQGVNLRGLAPSGVSRALVLVDGIPINDPFGGWIYWDRVPLLAVERVEVALGGGSAPYGSQALGGVVQIVTRRQLRGLELQALGGERAVARVGVAAGVSDARRGLLVAGELFHTDGYVEVAPAARGPVDAEVASSHQTLRLRYDDGPATVVVEALRERRDNGTPQRRNDTWLGGASLRWSAPAAADGRGWEAHAYGRRQKFDSTFSTVSDDRTSERPVLLQEVPSTDLGGGVLGWWNPGEATVSLGGDWRRVSGTSEETVVFSGATREPGGTQHLGGAYAAISRTVLEGAVHVTASARWDGWHQSPRQDNIAASGGGTLSPRAGLAWHASPGVAVRGSAYRSFRAPTLNELYRQFRVGDVTTLANPDLEAEELRGVEAGVDWTGGPGGRLRAGATLYRSSLGDAVVNATLSPEDPTLRQRHNVGDATVVGLELDAGLRLARRWRIDAALALLEATFDAGAGVVSPPAASDLGVGGTPEEGAAPATDLGGNRLPQVPEVRGDVSVRYAADRWGVLLDVRGVGEQFEDDRNELPLAGAVTVSFAAHAEIGPALRLTIRGENLLDQEVAEGRGPVLLLGPPRTLYGGLSLSWPIETTESHP